MAFWAFNLACFIATAKADAASAAVGLRIEVVDRASSSARCSSDEAFLAPTDIDATSDSKSSSCILPLLVGCSLSSLNELLLLLLVAVHAGLLGGWCLELDMANRLFTGDSVGVRPGSSPIVGLELRRMHSRCGDA